jgi:hypothetical protein
MSPIRTVYWEHHNAGSAVNAGNGDGGGNHGRAGYRDTLELRRA